MENIMNEFLVEMKNSEHELTIDEIVEKISHDLIPNNINNKLNNNNNIGNKNNQNIDFLSDVFNQKSTEEKIRIMNDCFVEITRIPVEDIINKHKVDYLEVKKYYEIESEEEYDYSIINNNIYDKCNQNESCVRLRNLFNDDSAEDETISDILVNKKSGKTRKRRKRMPFSPQESKKKPKISETVSSLLKRPKVPDVLNSTPVSDLLNRSRNRSIDEKLSEKTLISNNTDNRNTNNRRKQDLKSFNGQNNTFNDSKSDKSKEKSSKSVKTKKKTNNTSTPIPAKQNLNKKSVPNNSCNNNLFNNSVYNSSESDELISFMGTRFRARDLLNRCNECENGCEIDELTLAFHVLMTSPEDELPNDLRLDVSLDSDEETEDELNDSVINSENDLNNLLPKVDDIYSQTIEEEIDLTINNPALLQEIDNFLKNTTFSQQSTHPIDTQFVNNYPYFDPLMPMPSTSGYNSNLNQDVLQPELMVLPEDLISVTPLNINSSQTVTAINTALIENHPIINSFSTTDRNVINNPMVEKTIPITSTQASDHNSSISSTADSLKKVNYRCFHCSEKFDHKKQFQQHCNDTHPGLPKGFATFSPLNSPIKTSTPIITTTTTASTLNFNVKSNTTQVFIVNEPQNITITSSLDSIQRNLQFSND